MPPLVMIGWEHRKVAAKKVLRLVALDLVVKMEVESLGILVVVPSYARLVTGANIQIGFQQGTDRKKNRRNKGLERNKDPVYMDGYSTNVHDLNTMRCTPFI